MLRFVLHIFISNSTPSHVLQASQVTTSLYTSAVSAEEIVLDYLYKESLSIRLE